MSTQLPMLRRLLPKEAEPAADVLARLAFNSRSCSVYGVAQLAEVMDEAAAEIRRLRTQLHTLTHGPE